MQKRKLREPVHSFLAGISADPLGIFLLGREEIVLVFIGAAILFLPLFVFLKGEKNASVFFEFLPKMIRRAMKANADAIIFAFGKNEQVKKCYGRCSLLWPGWSWPGARFTIHTPQSYKRACRYRLPNVPECGGGSTSPGPDKYSARLAGSTGSGSMGGKDPATHQQKYLSCVKINLHSVC